MNLLKINFIQFNLQIQFDFVIKVVLAPYIYGPVGKFEIGTPKWVVPSFDIWFASSAWPKSFSSFI